MVLWLYFITAVGSHSSRKYHSISETDTRYHHPLFLRSIITLFTYFCFFNSVNACLNSPSTLSQKLFISI